MAQHRHRRRYADGACVPVFLGSHRVEHARVATCVRMHMHSIEPRSMETILPPTTKARLCQACAHETWCCARGCPYPSEMRDTCAYKFPRRQSRTRYHASISVGPPRPALHPPYQPEQGGVIGRNDLGHRTPRALNPTRDVFWDALRLHGHGMLCVALLRRVTLLLLRVVGLRHASLALLLRVTLLRRVALLRRVTLLLWLVVGLRHGRVRFGLHFTSPFRCFALYNYI